MPSIDSTAFGRSARVRGCLPRRLLVMTLLCAMLSACGTLNLDPVPLEESRPTMPLATDSAGGNDEAATMPEAIAIPEAAMPGAPTTQSARRSSRRGQPLPAPTPGRDGPSVRPAEELLAVPDAAPRDEPLHPSANRPYTLFGRHYTPRTTRSSLTQSGLASWYGSYFHGRRTSTGEIYDMHAMSAAHPTMALPSYARVTNTATGKSVVVRVNDRGPFVGDRIIDLSYAAAVRLGFAAQGVATVTVETFTGSAGPTDTLASSASVSGSAASVAATTTSMAGNNGSSRESNRAAARSAPVRLTTAVEKAEHSAPPTSAPGSAARKAQEPAKVFVKIGAFRQRMNATRVGERIAKTLPAVQKSLSITSRDDGILLVQAGPYADRSEAVVVAEALRRELQIEPQIVIQ